MWKDHSLAWASAPPLWASLCGPCVGRFGLLTALGRLSESREEAASAVWLPHPLSSPESHLDSRGRSEALFLGRRVPTLCERTQADGHTHPSPVPTQPLLPWGAGAQQVCAGEDRRVRAQGSWRLQPTSGECLQRAGPRVAVNEADLSPAKTAAAAATEGHVCVIQHTRGVPLWPWATTSSRDSGGSSWLRAWCPALRRAFRVLSPGGPCACWGQAGGPPGDQGQSSR